MTDLSKIDRVKVSSFGDSPSLDAFGRVRTSETGQRLDVEFLYDKQTDYFDELTDSGTVTHNANSRDLTLSLSNATNGSYATMRSYPAPYTPGNSQLIDITGVLDLAGLGGGYAETFVRSSVTGSVVETTVIQSEWDTDFSDTDWTKAHIFTIDFQSLKVGRIRYMLNVDGMFQQVTTVKNDNLYNVGFWQLANGGVYWKIYNTATKTIMELGYGDEANAVGFRYVVPVNASATMKAICCTVKSEGGQSLRSMDGLSRSIDMGVTEKTVSTTLIPLISIRPKTTFQSKPNLIISIPKDFSVLTDNPIRIVIVHDGTLTDPSWADVNTVESSVEYDVTASAITGGHPVHSEYGSAAKNSTGAGTGLLGKNVLWNRLDGTTGILTVCAVKTGATDAECLASLNWEEIR